MVCQGLVALIVVDVICAQPGVTTEQLISKRAIDLVQLSLEEREVELEPVVGDQADGRVQACQEGGEAGDQVGVEPSLLLQVVIAQPSDVLHVQWYCCPRVDAGR